MSLETVPNDLDPAIHAYMDQRVLKTIETTDDEHSKFSPIFAVILLTAIVSTSEGRLDAKYKAIPSAKALLDKYHPDLKDLLKVAWREKSFKEIRNLKILRVSEIEQAVALGAPMEQQDAVAQAFNLEYRGLAYRNLLQAVDEITALPSICWYSKIIPIVQSSGTGKSKMVDKIATERILFPLCLRQDLEDYAYPPTDIGVRNYLLGAPSTTDEKKCNSHLRSFFFSLFTSAHLHAKTFVPAGEKVSYAYIAEKFYNLFKDTSSRNAFYQRVLSTSSSSTSAGTSEAFQALEDFLEQCCSDWPLESCPILISMDEIQVLFELRVMDGGSTINLYSRLKSVLNEMATEHLCVVFLSTAFNTERTPSKDIKPVHPSMRASYYERFVPTPFTELPFDVHIIAEPLAPGQESLTSVGSLGFTAKFGRPLFYAAYLSHTARNEHTPAIIWMMRTVREKLFGKRGERWPPMSPADFDVTSIAVLSARLLLELSPASPDAQKYEQELVRSHLRTLFSVQQDQLSLVSGSSPEPLLAEAAAQIMHLRIGSEKVPYMNVWDLLVTYVDNGLAPRGTVGQLIGRVLSITTMDNAIDALSKRCELKYQTPISVINYYKASLTDEAWESLRLSTPANRAQLSEQSATTTFEQAFAEAYLHFSHYGNANDATSMQDRYAWALWLRGTAILCQLNQELTDRAYPIFFAKFGTVSPQSVSISLNKDKTGQIGDPRVVGIQSAEALGLFSPGNRQPYIAAVHYYALTDNEGISVGMPTSKKVRHPEQDEEAPRYQIDFRGLASYKNLTDHTKTEIRRIIDDEKNDLFKRHTRPYGLPALRQMLPVLQEDPDATAWFGGCSPAQVPLEEKGKSKEVVETAKNTLRVKKRGLFQEGSSQEVDDGQLIRKSSRKKKQANR